MSQRAQGFALILVIWALVLLASLATGFAYGVRHEIRVAADMASTARAEAVATAALHTAALALNRGNVDGRWLPDGEQRTVPWPDATIRIRVQSEGGRIDINRAPRELLLGLLSQFTAPARAEALVDALIDWRDPDDEPQDNGAERDAYLDAGRRYTPSNAPFNSVSELHNVLGFDSALAEAVQPYLTVHSRRPRVNVLSADLVVLSSVPGLDRDDAWTLINQRARILAEGGRMDFSALRSGRQYLESRPNERVLSLDIDVRLDDGLQRREHAVIALHRTQGFVLLERETRPADPTADDNQP